MTGYAGDFSFGHVLVPLPFPTHKGDGTPTTLAGTPTVTVYKDNTTTKSTSGVTLTVDLDGVAGSHVVKIDTSADAAFYASGHDFVAKLSAGTVDSISVVGYIVGSFSIENRSALRPTVQGRTLDVASSGEAGLDFTNRLDTTGILPAAQAGGSGGLAVVGSAMEVATKTGFSLSVTPPTAQNIWEYGTRALTDKSNFALAQAFPANFASLIISALGKITVGQNDDKSGYALTSALSAQNVWEYATRSLSTSPPTALQIDTQLSSTHGSGTWGTGVGSSSLDITVTSSGEPIEGIMVEVYTSSAKTGFVRKTTTDGAGLAHFDVNAGTYYIWVLHSDYTGTNPTTVTVT
ncbi:MAG: hypothetical protein M0R80_04320 [Proteobacteria bacterium]|jgi:hypothetical protein|nr:hypothetical protein [Pseudomonadota bacterium]